MLMPDTETGDPGCPMCMEPLLTILNTEIFAGVASAEVGSAMRGGMSPSWKSHKKAPQRHKKTYNLVA
jgi:hypothetical protein